MSRKKATQNTEEEQDTPAIINISEEDAELLAESMGVNALREQVEQQEGLISELMQAFSDLAVYANRLHEHLARLEGEPMVKAKVQGTFANGSFQIVRDRAPNIPSGITHPDRKQRSGDPVLNMVVE